MGLLQFLRGIFGSTTPEPEVSAEPAHASPIVAEDTSRDDDEPEFFPVVGESYRQPALLQLLADHPDRGVIVLVAAEPENTHDPNAVAIRTLFDEPLGYLPRDIAKQFAYRVGLVGPLSCPAKLHGGTPDRPSVGIVVNATFFKDCVKDLPARPAKKKSPKSEEP